jgi:hypothetical protein
MKNFNILMFIVFLVFSSCEKDFLSKSNPNQLTLDSFYKTQGDAITAVNSVYAVMQHMDLFRQSYWSMYNGMSDDISFASSDGGSASAMFSFTYSPTFGTCNDMWGTLYTGIFRANQVIKNVGNMESFDLQNRVIAEAKFLRAWYYRELVAGWGGVPKITEPLEGAQFDYNFPRATVQEIYNLIEEDLKYAEKYLPLKSEYPTSDIGRATSGAASAYLGKAYLFQKKWSDAITEFEKVVNSGEYQLTTKFGDNFSAATENNSESVFEVQFTGEGTGVWNEDDSSLSNESNLLAVSYFNWLSAAPMYQFKRNQLFGPASAGRSPRYNATFATNKGGAPRIKKFVEFNTSDFRRSDVNLRDLRYSDVWLMYAEALNENSRTPDAKVAIDKVIDRVRQEQGLTDPTAATKILDLKTVQQLINYGALENYTFSDDQTGIRNIVKYQRRIEFMFEMKRYRDLIRWNDAPAAFAQWIIDNGGNKVFKVGKNELFPIPDTEISGNSGISVTDQNPGY